MITSLTGFERLGLLGSGGKEVKGATSPRLDLRCFLSALHENNYITKTLATREEIFP